MSRKNYKIALVNRTIFLIRSQSLQMIMMKKMDMVIGQKVINMKITIMKKMDRTSEIII
jgi:hypothetical protein